VRLANLIAGEVAAAGGWLGFDRYMDLALYAPGLGYYTAGTHKIGASVVGGDFITAPEISPLFGCALATQVAQVLQLVAAGRPGRILEFGAGTGRLARDILDELRRRDVAIERYQIVEVSADLRARQRELLGRYPIEWLDAPPRRFEGVILANEVLDVMPVRLFTKIAGAICERGVALHGDAFCFDERPADARLREEILEIEAETQSMANGYTSEIGLVARGWVVQLAELLSKGVALLIDYGFPRHEYYHPQRLMGTIMCHYRHHSHADPFWLPGLNDITAHIDWSAIAATAHAEGLDVLGYTTQANFLINCGLLDLLAHDHAPVHASAAQRLLSESEMGELFKVLALGRGVPEPLLGFARGDRLDRL